MTNCPYYPFLSGVLSPVVQSIVSLTSLLLPNALKFSKPSDPRDSVGQ